MKARCEFVMSPFVQKVFNVWPRFFERYRLGFGAFQNLDDVETVAEFERLADLARIKCHDRLMEWVIEHL